MIDPSSHPQHRGVWRLRARSFPGAHPQGRWRAEGHIPGRHPGHQRLPRRGHSGAVPDLPLSSPTVGFDAQAFEDGSGTRIFSGADIYDSNGSLLHHLDASQLGLTYPPLVNGVWISGNLFAAVDGPTSTIILYTVP